MYYVPQNVMPDQGLISMYFELLILVYSLKTITAECANSSSINIFLLPDDPNIVVTGRNMKGFWKQVFKELEK